MVPVFGSSTRALAAALMIPGERRRTRRLAVSAIALRLLAVGAACVVGLLLLLG